MQFALFRVTETKLYKKPVTLRLLCVFGFLAYKVPTKKRKTTVMDQVSALVSATVAQLREMDSAMQAQEDARLQRLMDHEREMQNNLMNQLAVMHERVSQENHERHMELVDRILSRFPSSSAPSGRWLTSCVSEDGERQGFPFLEV